MLLVSLVTLWFHLHGHRDVQFPHRPWYKKKKEPSFADMLTTLRRLSWEELWREAVGNERRAKEIFYPDDGVCQSCRMTSCSLDDSISKRTLLLQNLLLNGRGIGHNTSLKTAKLELSLATEGLLQLQ